MTPTAEAVDQSEEILCDIIVSRGMKVLHMTPNEMLMSESLSQRFAEMADDIAHGRKVYTAEEVFEEGNRIAEEYGYESGLPLPTLSNKLGSVIPARGTPLSGLMTYNAFRTELEEEGTSQGIDFRNSWTQLGDRTVGVVDSDAGPIAVEKYHAGWRLRKLLKTMSTRVDSQNSVEAELRALESLKEKVNPSQYRCYVLNGMFPERSTRSDLHYIFRKGYPTIVTSYHGNEAGSVLACLCFHVAGYHKGTYAGVMSPTDDVVAALLTMRADEHSFWKKSGQWPAWDTRSGI
jgi:hypothetical protein